MGKVRFPAGARNFFLLQNAQTGPGSHPATWEKWPGRKADHSPTSSAEVNEWSYTSTPTYAFILFRAGVLKGCASAH